MLSSSAGSLILFPDLHCLQSPSAPVGFNQEGEKILGLGDLLGRRTGMRNSDKKEGQEMGKDFIRHASCMSNAVWRSLWWIPAPHHSLNEVSKLNQLCSLYLTCQTCSSGQEDQDGGGPHQQDNTCGGQHPGTTLSVSFPGPSALASISSQQKVCFKILRKDSTALHLNEHCILNHARVKFTSCESTVKAKSRPPRRESDLKWNQLLGVFVQPERGGM